MGVKTLDYTYLNNTIFKLKNMNVDEETYLPLHLFHITHSKNINWIKKEFNHRDTIQKILINISYYKNTIPEMNEILFEKGNLKMSKYSEFKEYIVQLLKNKHLLNSKDLQQIVIAPILYSLSSPIIGIFILNNINIINKITNNTNNKYIHYSFLSEFNKKKNNKYELIKNINFINKVGNQTIKSHLNSRINFGFTSLPLSMVIKNICCYFPKLDVNEIDTFKL